MGLRNALRMMRSNAFVSSWDRMYQATPPGAERPSSTFWVDPSGMAPPVTFVPSTGVLETHWDWELTSALAIPGVWRARMLISQAIGGMPLGAYRGAADPVAPLPQILREPCPGEDRCNTIASWVCDLLDHGNAIGVIDGFDSLGRATSLTPVPCAQVEVRLNNGRREYRVGGATTFDQSEVFHAKGTSVPGSLRGFGVLEAQLTSLARMKSEQDYAARSFGSGVPSGIVTVKDPDLSPDAAADVKADWVRAFTGPTRAPAVMSELMSYEPIAWTPTDAQMVEARTLSLTDVANIYNLDHYWLGAPARSMTYQNVQQAAVALSRFTLSFWITSLEAQLSRLLPRGMDARFNMDTILRDDVTTRFAAYKVAVDGGWLTVDEIRADEGMRPLSEVDPSATPIPASADPSIVDPLPLFPAGDQSSNANLGRTA